MNFSAYSIKNPLVAILLFTLLTLGGFFAFKQMKIQQFPDIDLPAVVVTVTMAGASPDQLENDVAKRVENRLSGIDGIKHMGTTVQTGAVTVVSEFALEKDIQEALDDVRSAVSEVRSNLPAAANEPIVSKVSTAGFPVVGYSVASDAMSPVALSWWVDDVLTKRLSDIEGVGQIGRVGGVERQITVAAKPERLAGWQLPISTLSQQLSALWNDATGGEAKVGGGVQTIRVVGAGESLQTLQSLPIKTPMGATRLDTVADVYDGISDKTSEAALNGRSVVAFHITRSRGASEVAMVALIEQELNKIRQENPDVRIDKIYDYAKPIYEDYQSSLRMLIEGCILAVVVVLVFLKNWRATLVATAALPLSIIPTFLAMYLFGFTLNMISLLALSLVIGVLVDDAIVEVENITRHLQMGKTPYQAAMEAADEIGLAVIATTLTLIAVFLPTAFMNGIVGQFFQQFGWTASIAIFMSLLVARLITPMMAAYLLKPQQKESKTISQSMQKYLSVVRWTLSHRLATIALTLGLFIGSLMLVQFLPTAFMPDDDGNQTQVTIELTPDATLSDATDIGRLASDAVQSVDGVSAVFLSARPNGASLDVNLKPREDRPTKTTIESNIRTALTQVAGARFRVGLSAGGESGYGFSLTSSNARLLNETVAAVVKDIEQIDGVSVTTNKALPKPEIAVVPKRLALAERGVHTSDIANTLRIATQGDYAARLPKMNFDSRQVPIVVKLSDKDKGDLTVLKHLYVPSSNPNGVQVGEVATLQFGSGDSEIRRLDRERAIKITVDSSVPLGQLIGRIQATPTLSALPSGVSVVAEGQAESMKELFEGFVLAMGVGIFCIFAVLILLFHRLLQPFTILMALPLSIGGAFVGLLLTGSSLSMPSMIGFVMLMGIATKNSILLVDYAIMAQNAGKSQLEAIMDACQKRARPIIMTTIAMGAGMLPLVFGWGGADTTFRQPMAAAVLGGLITSTLLSLVVIPVIYTLMDDLSGFFGRKSSKIDLLNKSS